MVQDVDLRYPIGKAAEQPNAAAAFAEEIKLSRLKDIEMAPSFLEHAILNLDEHQLNSAYREGGWTVKQVVHHVADSHMNAYTRFKLALTEDNPVIKPYDEAAWANLSDSNLPVNISLTLLHALHKRWLDIMQNMTDADWEKTFFHPEHKQSMTLWNVLATYAWHGKHHTAHITSLRDRMGW